MLRQTHMRRYLVLFFAFASSVATAQTFTLKDNFNIDSSNNAPWSAGRRTSFTSGTFITFENVEQLQGFRARNASNLGFHPAFGIQRPTGTNPFHITATEDEIGIHPGPNGEISSVRFTTPSAGRYRVSYAFQLRDQLNEDGEHTGDINLAVTHNLALIDTATLAGYLALRENSTELSLLAGDTLEFAVDRGPSNSGANDWTALDVRVEAVPEPSSLIAIGLGGALWLHGFRRRRQRNYPCARLPN